MTSGYPELTPYQFASNRPIDGIDLDGLEYRPARSQWTYRRQPWLSTSNASNVRATYRQTTTYRQALPSPRKAIEYVQSDAKPHQLNPQYTPGFKGSSAELIVNAFRGVNEIKKFSERLKVDVKSVETYDVTYDNYSTNSKKEFVFDGPDAVKLFYLEQVYQQKVEQFVENRLETLTKEKINKSYGELSPDEKTEFRMNNSGAVQLIRIRALFELGPSPKPQVSQQIQNGVKEGTVTQEQEAPERQPSITASHH